MTRWIQPEQSKGAHARVLVEERACLFSFGFLYACKGVKMHCDRGIERLEQLG